MKTTAILGLLISASTAFGADDPRAITPARTGKVISVGTRLERIDPALLQAHGHWVLGMPSSQSYPLTTFPASHDAEPINVRAMRRYQERWELHIRSPQSLPSPTLYPSRVEQMLERIR